MVFPRRRFIDPLLLQEGNDVEMMPRLFYSLITILHSTERSQNVCDKMIRKFSVWISDQLLPVLLNRSEGRTIYGLPGVV